MTPTHLLIPIKITNEIGDTRAFEQDLNKAILVDLSEEAITIMAKSNLYPEGNTSINDEVRDGYFIVGYQQCAKDLLNTKP